MLRNVSALKSSIITGTLMLFVGFILGWIGATFYGYQSPWSTQVATLLGPGRTANMSTPQQLRDQFGLFWEVWDLVEAEFYQERPIDHQRMIQGAINGMLSSLEDPYTAYQEPNLAAQTNDHMQGSFEGIGAYVRITEGKAYIDRPIKDSPALKAGLQQDDEIVKIDGASVEELIAGLDGNEATVKVTAQIRGPKDTEVRLTIRRAPDDQPFDVAIKRAEVIISSVNSQLLSNGVAYIQITDFKANTTMDFDDALRELLPQQPKGMILDLRNNPGGYLTNAQEVLGRFYDGVALHEEDSAGTLRSLNTISGPAETKVQSLPLVVLINGNSASASEIVAGALYDERVGTYLIGEKTFGKGSVQNIHTLSDGGSARITFAHWLTPDKSAINKIGITPEYVLPYTEDPTHTVPCVADRRPPEGQTTCADSQLASALQLLTTGQAPSTIPAATK
ncbi:MAG: S41 family peptidase [Blastochloris sp.]|nr:S41 family peptidase [Blastochloris sp.]